MRVQVPQFIFRDPKIFGPLTFKQFIYVGIAIAIVAVFYFTWGPKHIFIFMIVSALLLVGSLLLATSQMGGKSLPAVLANFFLFSFSKKIYLWHKKEVPIKLMAKTTKPLQKKAAPETPVLKIAEKSRLRNLSSDIDLNKQR